jgi:D-lactate dehydrogenase
LRRRINYNFLCCSNFLTTRGFRSGEGEAEAVVLPDALLELWKVLQACVAAGKIVIMQAANTGLTEGSTPSGSYDRP